MTLTLNDTPNREPAEMSADAEPGGLCYRGIDLPQGASRARRAVALFFLAVALTPLLLILVLWTAPLASRYFALFILASLAVGASAIVTTNLLARGRARKWAQQAVSAKDDELWKHVAGTVAKPKSHLTQRHLEALAAALLERGARGTVLLLRPTEWRAPRVLPAKIPFEAQPLDESTEHFWLLAAELGLVDSGGNSRDGWERQHKQASIARGHSAVAQAMGLATLLLYVARDLIPQGPLRIASAVGIFLSAGAIAYASTTMAQSPADILAAPGAIVLRRVRRFAQTARVYVLRARESILILGPNSARRAWSFHAWDGQHGSGRVISHAEAEFLLAAWSSALAAPELGRLSDLGRPALHPSAREPRS